MDLAHTLLRAQLAVSVHEADGTPVDATGAAAVRAGRSDLWGMRSQRLFLGQVKLEDEHCQSIKLDSG